MDSAGRHGRFELAFYAMCLILSLFWSLPTQGILDFSSFYGSGEAAALGENPYAIHDRTFLLQTAWFSGYNFNLNPPTVLPLFEGFAAFEIAQSYWGWWSISIVLGIALLRLLKVHYGDAMPTVAVVWCLALGSFWDTLHLGQIYIPLAFCAVLAWISLRRGRRRLLAGVLIGVVAAVKPNFLVWPVVLLLAGHIAPAMAAFASFLALVAISLGLYGGETWAQWFDLLASEGARDVFPTNGSVAGFLHRIGLGAFGVWASLALLAATGGWALWRRPPVMLASAVGLLVSLLASPIGWAHYFLLAVPILIELWDRRGWTGRFASMALAVPLVLVVISPPDVLAARVTVGSLYFWTFLAVFALVARHGAALDLPLAQTRERGPRGPRPRAAGQPVERPTV